MKLKRKFGLIIYLFPAIVFMIILLFEVNYGINKVKADNLTYNERGDISYKVYLKKNNYYDTPYLDENSSYIASLIDNFLVRFNYTNTFSDDVKYRVKYNITADLVVFDSDNKVKPIYEKSYVLLNDKEITGNGKMAKVDILNQVIDYDKYNKIVQSLKQEVVPTANLVIKFNTKLDATNKKIDKNIKSNYTSSLSIPISQKTINIDLTKKSADNKKVISSKKKLGMGIIIVIISTAIVFIISIVCYINYIIKTAKKKSKYEQKVSKILREFDRAITEAKGELILDDDATKIEVKDFEELLDVHDNLNIPIIYYKISDSESVFLVRNNNKDVYYNVIRSEDFD